MKKPANLPAAVAAHLLRIESHRAGWLVVCRMFTKPEPFTMERHWLKAGYDMRLYGVWPVTNECYFYVVERTNA